MARPVKSRCICSMPSVTCFAPDGAPAQDGVVIGFDEYEALRLMDYVQLSQAECAARMGVSRATVARLYESARRAVAEALVLGLTLRIEGGDVYVCRGPRPECAGEKHCCHIKNMCHERSISHEQR